MQGWALLGAEEQGGAEGGGGHKYVLKSSTKEGAVRGRKEEQAGRDAPTLTSLHPAKDARAAQG